MTTELTPKEKECLHLAGRRLSDAEIAQRLDLSPRTVGNHLRNAYKKLGVHDRIRAAAKLSNLYPEYPLPIGYEDEPASSSSSSAQRTDTDAGGLAGAFAKLPPPPPSAAIETIIEVSDGHLQSRCTVEQTTGRDPVYPLLVLLHLLEGDAEKLCQTLLTHVDFQSASPEALAQFSIHITGCSRFAHPQSPCVQGA